MKEIGLPFKVLGEEEHPDWGCCYTFEKEYSHYGKISVRCDYGSDLRDVNALIEDNRPFFFPWEADGDEWISIKDFEKLYGFRSFSAWPEEENGSRGIEVYSEYYDVEFFIKEDEYGEEFRVDEDGNVFMKPETVTYFVTYAEF